MRLDILRPLYADDHGCAWVYLAASRATEDAAELIGLRWRAAREKLAGQGAGADTLDALEEVVTGQARPEPGLAAFARSGEVLFTARLPHPPRREISRYAPLPHLMPLLAQYRPQVTHLRVAADRSGGEIRAVRAAVIIAKEGVVGAGWPVDKTSVA